MFHPFLSLFPVLLINFNPPPSREEYDPVIITLRLLFSPRTSSTGWTQELSTLSELRRVIPVVDRASTRQTKVPPSLQAGSTTASRKPTTTTADDYDEEPPAPAPATGTPVPDLIAGPNANGNCVETFRDGQTCTKCFKGGQETEETCVTGVKNPDRKFKGQEPGPAHFQSGIQD